MNLAYHIIANHVHSLDRLDLPLRKRVQAASGLTELITENAALAAVQADFPQAPPWKNLRETVITLANNPEVNHMKSIHSTARRSFTVRLAFGSGLALLIVAALLLSPLSGLIAPTKAWAVSEGYVLRYTVPASSWADGSDCQHKNPGECDCAYLGDISRALQAWSQQNDISIELPQGNQQSDTLPLVVPLRSKITLDTGEQQGIVEVLAIGLSRTQLEQLQTLIEQNGSLSGGVISDASWYYVKCVAYNGTSFDIAGHKFCFPYGTSTAEMERLITEWLVTYADQLPPDAAGVVGVSIEASRSLAGRSFSIKLLYED